MGDYYTAEDKWRDVADRGPRAYDHEGKQTSLELESFHDAGMGAPKVWWEGFVGGAILLTALGIGWHYLKKERKDGSG